MWLRIGVVRLVLSVTRILIVSRYRLKVLLMTLVRCLVIVSASLRGVWESPSVCSRVLVVSSDCGLRVRVCLSGVMVCLVLRKVSSDLLVRMRVLA